MRRKGRFVDAMFAGFRAEQFPDSGIHDEQFINADAAVKAGIAAGEAAGRLAHQKCFALLEAERVEFGSGRGTLGPAVRAEAPHQALGHDRTKGGCQQIGLNAHVPQARDGTGGAVGVQGREGKTAGRGEFECDFGCFGVADLAHHDHIRVLTQDRTQRRRKGQADLVIHLRLTDTRQTIFDRVFQRHDIVAAIVEARQGSVERRGLSGPDRPGHEDHAVRLGQSLGEPVQRVLIHAKLGQPDQGILRVQKAQNDPFPVPGRQGRHAHIDGAPPDRQGDPAILRQALFRNVEPRHDLDAGDNGRSQLPRRCQHLDEIPVDPVANGQMILKRIDMDIGCTPFDGLMDQAVNQTDHWRIILSVQQVGRFRNVVDQAFQPAPAFHRGIDVIIRHRPLGKGLGQKPVIRFLVQRLERHHAAEGTPRLNERKRVGALAHADRQGLAVRQDDEPLVLGKGVGELGLSHRGGGLPRTSVMKLSMDEPESPSPAHNSSARM